MTYFWHAIIGLVVSFLASLPMGPVNLSVTKAAISLGRNVALRIALGSAFVELFYCLVAIYGLQLILGQDGLVKIITWISIPVLLGLGIYDLLKKIPERPNGDEPPTEVKAKGYFWVGVYLNILNPTLIPFWLGASTYLKSNDWIRDDLWHLMAFTLGVAIGTFLLLTTVAWVAARQRHGLPHSRYVLINRLIGATFVFFALWLLVQVLWLS